MRAVIQRVNYCKLSIHGKLHSEIYNGLLVLLGITSTDQLNDIKWLAKKIVQLRVFNDENGIMNISAIDKNYALMLVSQFTLHASTKKGNRPSYIRAANPEIAIPIYEKTLEEFKSYGLEIQTGIFGADMQIELVNDGPVTIIIDSHNKE